MWKATLDACVLYASTVRDLLLHMAAKNLFKPVWSDKINAEWVGSQARRRRKRDRLNATVIRMNTSFPDANIPDITPAMKNLKLPDKKDRHVLAAAIMSGSQILVTWNRKDFPPEYLKRFGIEVATPDQFIARLAFDRMHVDSFISDVYRAKFPGRNTKQIMAKLERCRLGETVKKMRGMLQETGKKSAGK